MKPLQVQCPQCGAPVGKQCKVRVGRAKAHAERKEYALKVGAVVKALDKSPRIIALRTEDPQFIGLEEGDL